MEVKTIGVVGSGVMGAGIAQVAAGAGFDVILQDIQNENLSKAQKSIENFTAKSVEKAKMTEAERTTMLSRLQYVTDLEAVRADLIIEAVPENLELKHQIFRIIESNNAPEAILATNTSSIPVTQIAACLKRPERCVGMHFFNPAPLMRLVEVIAGERTEPQVVDLIIELSKKMGKVPAVAKDTPGFIVNRVARQYYLESLKILEENIASFEDIDAIMKASGFKMGPFELMDLIGIDTNHEVTKSIYNSFFQEPRFRPSRIQQKKVEAGLWGRKTGKGFYNYTENK